MNGTASLETAIPAPIDFLLKKPFQSTDKNLMFWGALLLVGLVLVVRRIVR